MVLYCSWHATQGPPTLLPTTSPPPPTHTHPRWGRRGLLQKYLMKVVTMVTMTTAHHQVRNVLLGEVGVGVGWGRGWGVGRVVMGTRLGLPVIPCSGRLLALPGRTIYTWETPLPTYPPPPPANGPIPLL